MTSVAVAGFLASFLLGAAEEGCDTDFAVIQADNYFKEHLHLQRKRRSLFANITIADFDLNDVQDELLLLNAPMKVELPLKYYIPNGTGDEPSIDNFSFGRCRPKLDPEDPEYNLDAQSVAESHIDDALRIIETETGVPFERVYTADDVGLTGVIFGNFWDKNDPTSTEFPVDMRQQGDDKCYDSCYVNHIGARSQVYYDFVDANYGFNHGLVKFIHLGWCYNVTGSIIHEVMHKLGFEHEQKRTDRVQFISIDTTKSKWPNRIQNDPCSKWLYQWIFDETCDSDKSKLVKDGLIRSHGEFDFCSIQMYNLKSSSWDSNLVNATPLGYQKIADCMQENSDLYDPDDLEDCANPTTLATSRCVDVHRQRVGLSQGDIAAISALYSVNGSGRTSDTGSGTTSVPSMVGATGTVTRPGLVLAKSDEADSDTDNVPIIVAGSVGGVLVVGLALYFALAGSTGEKLTIETNDYFIADEYL